MNVTYAKLILTRLFLICLTGTATAQKDKSAHAEGPAHSHKAHNNGTVKSAGDYHIELVDKKNHYAVYLLDVAEKPVNLKGITGLAILRDGDRTVHTQKLIPTFNTHFVLSADNIEHNTIIINFTVNQQNITAKFAKDGAQAMNFFCPGNCKGSDSNLAGTCPKCGNALTDRRLSAKK